MESDSATALHGLLGWPFYWTVIGSERDHNGGSQQATYRYGRVCDWRMTESNTKGSLDYDDE